MSKIRTSLIGCESETSRELASIYAGMCADTPPSARAREIERYILRLKSVKELPSLMQETFGVTAAE